MARSGWSTSNFLRYNAAILTATPMTMAAWINPASLGSTRIIMGGFNSGGADTNRFSLVQSNTNAITATSRQASTGSVATATGTISVGTWTHACAVFASSTSRAAYFNGGGKGTNATASTPASINRTSIGVIDSSTQTNSYDGSIAEAALWNIALSDTDVASLAAGASPLTIHPEALVGYWPLIGVNSPENNILSNTSVMSVQGTLSQAAHPPIDLPKRRIIL